MNLPISFTHYFVNKQNVRSFSNIINVSLFKSENKINFLKHVFNDEVLVQKISPELWSILIEFKENVKLLSKQDFRNFFVNDSTNYLTSIDKETVFINCSNALRALIPKSIFGNNHNYKIFNKITKRIIYSMKRQCFDYFELCSSKWNFSCLPWSSLPKEILSKTLICILFWVHRYLLSAMLSLNFYVTSCKIDNDDNKLHFFWKSEWQRFYDKAVSNMILNRTLIKIRNLKNYSSLKASKNIHLKKDTPKLQLILKSKNNDYRVIVVYKRDSQKTGKYKIKERLNFLKVLTGSQSTKIETEYSKLHSNWVNQNYPKLYFVKTDLTNAFGSINKVKLLKILCEKHKKMQLEEKSLAMKKKFAILYREFVSELRSPLVIRTGSAFYEWNKGLVQGYTYSPALSELYYSYMDELYLSKYLQKTDRGLDLFLRVVDDYLYITDSLDSAHSFLKALTNYNNVNYDKTVINFQYENIQYSSSITFFGYTYDTENMNVGRATNVYIGQMCYKIAFTTAIANLEKFIENRIGKSGIYMSSHIFNFYYNSEALVWQHLFVTLCHCANKFCTILAIVCSEKHMSKYLPIYKKKVTVDLCYAIINVLMKNKPNDFKFIYCINHFRYLSFRALLLCAKQTSKCNGLIPYLNTYLTKSNCIYGKWREHYSMISVKGEKCMAVKEVCKRPDLKNIMREFNVLPEGFEGFKIISKNSLMQVDR